MNKSKIEWCDSTWNPVTGCLHGCEYCYAKKIANRFGKRMEDRSEYPKNHGGMHCVETKFINNPYPYIFEPTFHSYRLDEPARKTKSQNIFVCSMADLFGEWVPDECIEEVFAACDMTPQHRYLFLTKNPERYNVLAAKDIMSPYFWYGYSITGLKASPKMLYSKYHSFVSIEPLLDMPDLEFTKYVNTHWIIIGAETGNRKNKIVPKIEWIENIVKAADANYIPVFMKNSLIPIVGKENMRREFPWVVS